MVGDVCELAPLIVAELYQGEGKRKIWSRKKGGRFVESGDGKSLTDLQETKLLTLGMCEGKKKAGIGRVSEECSLG